MAHLTQYLKQSQVLRIILLTGVLCLAVGCATLHGVGQLTADVGEDINNLGSRIAYEPER